ncbi:outer membrane protein OmpW [Budvicia aquatica]|uniref:Outer membrane protein W n=1 Tax=Budvicia aquatica TaxID=82979 RepID=A0A2C6DSK5_9GAMM|nr:outer membrane protein OmpW [Budvicia aquatica]PHI31312.1 outer membrane protein OmpW [Budvicia aquatica]VFS51619.1 Outer membrane protein W precursor [Budvicia aquatica]
MKKLPLVCLIAATLAPSITFAHQAGDFLFRAGSVTVRPNEGSDRVLEGTGSFNVSNNTQLGLTFGYMITDNIGIELLGATPFKHDVGVGGVGNIATVKQLPPSLMAQYYFGNAESQWRPYLGAGINYTTFFSEDFNSTGKGAGLSNLSVDDSWGVALQAGVDYNIDKNWMVNTSVWWMNIDTDVKFTSTDAAGNRTNHSVSTRLDPFAFMFGVGYKF